MKASVFHVLLVIAGAFALPLQDVEIRDPSTGFIKESGQSLKINNFDYEYNGNLLKFKASIDNLGFADASNIVINHLYNNVFLGLFDFDLVLPEITLNVANSGLRAAILDYESKSGIESSVVMKEIRIAGQVKHNNGLIGLEVGDILMKTTRGGIESNIRVVDNGYDYRDAVNAFIYDRVLNTLKNYQMINIKDSATNRLTDESSSVCILLNATSYIPDKSYLSSNLQQQKSH